MSELVSAAQTFAAFGVFIGVGVVVSKVSRFTGRIEEAVSHMSKALDESNKAICSFRKQNDLDHEKLHERINRIKDCTR